MVGKFIVAVAASAASVAPVFAHATQFVAMGHPDISMRVAWFIGWRFCVQMWG